MGQPIFEKRALSLVLAALGVFGMSHAAEFSAAEESPESLKYAGSKVWDNVRDRAKTGAVAAGAAAKIISRSPDGKLWGEPFKPRHKSGRYTLGDSCEDVNRNGRCDQLYFGGIQRFENYKNPLTLAKLLGRGLRRDPGRYNTADGERDPLYARAFVLKAGGKKLGLVVVDVVGLMNDDVEKIREKVKDLGFDAVIVQATHNHAGPDTIGAWGQPHTRALPLALLDWVLGKNPVRMIDGKNPEFMAHLREQAAASLREADRQARRARVRFAKAKIPQVDGKSVFLDHRDPAVFDEFTHILQAQDFSGRTIATLAGVGMHPVLMGDRINLLSADVSGSIARRLESLMGGTGFHINGAVAGIDAAAVYGVDRDKGKDSAAREKAMAAIGEAVGKSAADALEKAMGVAFADFEIKTRKIFIPMDNPLFRDLSRAGIVDRPLYTNGIVDPDGQDLLTEMTLIILRGPKGEPLAEIFTIPGELSPEILLGGLLPPEKAANPLASPTPILKDHFRAPHQLLIGLGNDELGYIVPLNDFVFGSLKHPLVPSKDKFGRGHYLETVSAGSQMSVIVPLNLIGMLEEAHQGSTRWTADAISLRAREEALAAFADQPQAIPALVQLYTHEPFDAVTPKVRQALLDMGRRSLSGRYRVGAGLIKARSAVKTPSSAKMISELLREQNDFFGAFSRGGR